MIFYFLEFSNRSLLWWGCPTRTCAIEHIVDMPPLVRQILNHMMLERLARGPVPQFLEETVEVMGVGLTGARAKVDRRESTKVSILEGVVEVERLVPQRGIVGFGEQIIDIDVHERRAEELEARGMTDELQERIVQVVKVENRQ